jgi:hypothetical protein
MPIFEYTCPKGHKTEFLKLGQDKEPDTCQHACTTKQTRTGRYETFTCGLPLEKQVSVGSFTMDPWM